MGKQWAKSTTIAFQFAESFTWKAEETVGFRGRWNNEMFVWEIPKLCFGGAFGLWEVEGWGREWDEESKRRVFWETEKEDGIIVK